VGVVLWIITLAYLALTGVGDTADKNNDRPHHHAA